MKRSYLQNDVPTPPQVEVRRVMSELHLKDYEHGSRFLVFCCDLEMVKSTNISRVYFNDCPTIIEAHLKTPAK